MGATLTPPEIERRICELQAALKLRPGDAAARFALGVELMRAGRFAEAWPLMDARKELRPDNVRVPDVSAPEWRGEMLAGRTLVVINEQGFGDQIMMARFAPLLRERGARVILMCWTPLRRLFEPLADVVVPLDPGEWVRVPAFDCWTHYCSLPWFFGTTPWNMPSAPYLAAPGATPTGRTGLMWRSGSVLGNDKNLPEDLARGLLEAGLVSLQPEDTGAQDFADTAEIIAGLDAVVTIDTAVAHLAGAMGKPTRVLLPASGPDWRWGLGDTTPWYPTARLYRQRIPGDWRDVIEAIKAELA